MRYLDFLPVAIYLVLIIYVGLRARRRNARSDEFLLGSRYLTLPSFVATLVATWYGGILGIGEFVFNNGVSAWFVFGLPYYIFALLYALLLAGKVRRSGSYSIPDILYNTYSRPVGLAGSLFLIVMTSPAPYILTLAIIWQYLFHTGFFTSIIFGTTFSMIYVYWGGFRSVAETNKLQFGLMFGGFILLLVFLAMRAPSLFEVGGNLDAAHKSPGGGLPAQQIFVWFMIASWTFIDPGFHQRCSAAKSPSVARRGILVAVAFWFVFDMLTIGAGLYAAAFMKDTTALMIYPELGRLVLPPFLFGIFITGLLSVVMSTVDSYAFLSAITIGHDILERLRPVNGDRQRNNLIRIGLMATAILSILLIMLFPSVVQLWYTLGSLFIPALLLPLLTAYFPRWRLSSAQTLSAMIIPFLTSLLLFISGSCNGTSGTPKYLFGVEPFFPGLLLSVLIYVLFNLKNAFGEKDKDVSEDL
jgi:SSS family solute:Na+ symporter